MATGFVWRDDWLPPPLVASCVYGYDTAPDCTGMDGEYGVSGELQVVGAEASIASSVCFFL